jgi:hypothetical protein
MDYILIRIKVYSVYPCNTVHNRACDNVHSLKTLWVHSTDEEEHLNDNGNEPCNGVSSEQGTQTQNGDQDARLSSCFLLICGPKQGVRTFQQKQLLSTS